MQNKETKQDAITRLTNISVQEVSMVDKGANRRTWAVVKRAQLEEGEALVKQFAAAKAGDADAIKAILKELIGQLSDEVLKELGLQRLVEEEPAGETDETPPEAPAGEPASGAEDKAKDQPAVEQAKLAKRVEELEQELTTAKKALNTIVPAQSGGEPRGTKPGEKSDGMIHTLGLKPLNGK